MFRRQTNCSFPLLELVIVLNMVLIILLCFFSVFEIRSTAMKSNIPDSQLKGMTQLVRKTLSTYIYVGKDNIMINDASATVGDIGNYFTGEKASMSSADKKNMSVILTIDGQTSMKVVSDIRRVLLQSGITNIYFQMVNKK